jgi:hypothetical protein
MSVSEADKHGTEMEELPPNTVRFPLTLPLLPEVLLGALNRGSGVACGKNTQRYSALEAGRSGHYFHDDCPVSRRLYRNGY